MKFLFFSTPTSTQYPHQHLIPASQLKSQCTQHTLAHTRHPLTSLPHPTAPPTSLPHLLHPLTRSMSSATLICSGMWHCQMAFLSRWSGCRNSMANMIRRCMASSRSNGRLVARTMRPSCLSGRRRGGDEGAGATCKHITEYNVYPRATCTHTHTHGHAFCLPMIVC